MAGFVFASMAQLFGNIADTIFLCHLKVREVDKKEDDLYPCHKLTETKTIRHVTMA